ncbi:glycosyltransferase family 2 protein [Priestia aryabhattai]|uniref:glycosyltransferase family 2 protein n=1 Tax=Priestia aryabhattai TaxID=412384 RepID=UPI001C8E28D3|nr:glycosyltransferase family 2 protein [Priestia aryabhattai]MBX9987787.1 glycosyltransferase family 2 protein [Priestia aryabhattai]
MNNPLISIIVPVYNVEAYLERCINSILNQTYRHLELIAINDGSTDGSLRILEKMAKTDERIVIHTKKNGGQASARNLGLKCIQGDYVIMVDSDDYIQENLIERCLTTIKETNCDLVLFDRYNINEKGEKKYFSAGNGTTMTDACSAPWNKFYKADLWKGYFFPEGFWYEDLGIVPVIIAKAKKIVNINEPLYLYDVSREGSQTNQIKINKLLDVKYMLDNVYKEITDLGLIEKKKDELEKLYIEHLVYITILVKVTKVKERKIRAELIDEIKSSLDSKFPNWRKNDFSLGNSITRRIRNIVIKLYLSKMFILGDIIWKLPKKLKYKFTGF